MTTVITLLSFVVATATAANATLPMSPPQAIALAEAHPNRATTGVFAMKVAAAERRPNALYLNSDADYRSPNDITFNITPIVAKMLEKRLGSKPEDALIGKNVIFKGELKLLPVANMVAGRLRSFNRYQHTVFVHDASQIVIQ
ncbi:hypothetical protein U1763_18915 [Sphingomonas sp. LB2R24]|uniref:hypothetical protein n=1 Tax=Sphingomonas sorbitolis TaxID=3096165 RepID=UPI002FCCA0C5